MKASPYRLPDYPTIDELVAYERRESRRRFRRMVVGAVLHTIGLFAIIVVGSLIAWLSWPYWIGGMLFSMGWAVLWTVVSDRWRLP